MSDEETKKVVVGSNEPDINNTNPSGPSEVPEEFIDREFQVPTDDVPLPSEGIFYANNQKSVEIKYLTAEDENILLSPELIRSGRVLDVLLENSVISKDLRPSEMLTGDRNAVLLALRTTGYGDEYDVKITCSECGEEFSVTVILSKLKTKGLSDKPDNNGEFAVTLPKMKIPIKFRLLNGADEARLTKVSETGKRRLTKDISVSTLLTERLLLHIMEANGNRDKIYIKKMISAMPIYDSLFLREYIRNIEPGVDMTDFFTCTHCGATKEYDIPITAKLFWPNANI